MESKSSINKVNIGDILIVLDEDMPPNMILVGTEIYQMYQQGDKYLENKEMELKKTIKILNLKTN